MTKHSLQTSRDTLWRQDSSTCDSYAPGHHIYYQHQGAALRSPSLVTRDALLDDTLVTLVLEDGRELHWRHHDPERLGRILELLRGKTRVHLEHHALRVGPYWFNCASDLDVFEDCRRRSQLP